MRILVCIGLLLVVYTFVFSEDTQPRLDRIFDKQHDSVKQTIERPPREAGKSLNEISGPIRMMLKSIRKEEVTVKEDIEFLDLHLDMTERRMGKKMSVKSRFSQFI